MHTRKISQNYPMNPTDTFMTLGVGGRTVLVTGCPVSDLDQASTPSCPTEVSSPDTKNKTTSHQIQPKKYH